MMAAMMAGGGDAGGGVGAGGAGGPGSAGGARSGKAARDALEDCCHLRQACFQICGMPKKECDESLAKCFGEACGAVKGSPAYDECRKLARIHQVGTMISGCKPYELSQAQACYCVDDDGNRPLDHRAVTLRRLYEIHNRTHLARVARNIDRHGRTAAKFAAFLRRLVKRYYPRSVKRVRGVKNKMEEMLEEHVGRVRPAPPGGGDGGDGRGGGQEKKREL